jgi:hypothetical protein
MTLLWTITVLLAPAQHERFGVPACSGPDRELADRAVFVLCHSSGRKVPLWVGTNSRPIG